MSESQANTMLHRVNTPAVQPSFEQATAIGTFVNVKPILQGERPNRIATAQVLEICMF